MSETSSGEVEQYDTINQLVTVGEFGYLAVDGPLSVEQDGTLWTVIIPTEGDDHSTPNALTLRQLRDSDGTAAVLIADCEAVGGGVVELTDEPEGEGALYVVVDQYAMGGA